MLPSLVRWLTRLAFVNLFSFEAANHFRVLHFTPNFTWLGLMISSFAVFVGVEVIARFVRRYGAAVHWSIWPLSFFVVGVDALGDIRHLYSRWIWYDQIGHFIGSMLAAVIIFSIIRAMPRTQKARLPEPVAPLLTFSLTVTLGALYEIEEYLEDFFNFTSRLGDGPDTGNDLLMDVLGAATAVLFVWLAGRVRNLKRKTPP